MAEPNTAVAAAEGNAEFEASVLPICMSAKEYYAKCKEGKAQPSYPLEELLRKNPLRYDFLQDVGNRSFLTAPTVVRHLINQGLIAKV